MIPTLFHSIVFPVSVILCVMSQNAFLMAMGIVTLLIYVIAIIIISSSENISNDKRFIGYRFMFCPIKKIYYNGIKNIYVILYKDRVLLFHNRTVYMRLLNNFHINLDYKQKIKEELDRYFVEKNKINSSESEFKKWSGCLTKADERDKKIDDIL